jgi:hypothetical protein
VDQSANRNTAFQEHPANLVTGRALAAAGRARDKDRRIGHKIFLQVKQLVYIHLCIYLEDRLCQPAATAQDALSPLAAATLGENER